MTDSVLHDADPGDEVTMPDGRVVRNLTAAEYADTYASGTVHDERPDTPADPTLAGEA